MKLLTLLLALYTLALSMVPCNDVHEGEANIPMTVQAAQEHHQEDKDICSPFCLCNCCQGFVVLTTVKNVQIVPVFSKEKFPLYTERFSSFFASDYWQPPRVG
jgi:hypothetical protein